MFDMRLCKIGDKLITRNGGVVTLTNYSPEKDYPYEVEYNDNKLTGSRTIMGENLIGCEGPFDIVDYYKEPSENFYLYGIKVPKTERGDSYIWWISNTEDKAWSAFFTYPNKDDMRMPYRLSLAEAKKAYMAIGYKCVKLEVKEITDV